MQNEVKSHHEKFNSFERSKDCINEFFSLHLKCTKIMKLSSVIKIILVLSHGQLAVEHSFSLGKSFIVETISKESIRDKKLKIKDHILPNNLTPSPIQITKKMQTDYKCAGTKYEIYLEQEKKKKSKIENDN